jgi:hypothetical protein
MKRTCILLMIPIALATAADQPWKDKQVAQWTADDAKQVLTDSPWAREATLTVNDKSKSDHANHGGGRGGHGGIGMGIPGIGGVGMPGGGRRGGGYPGGGGGYPQGGGRGGGGYPQDGGGGQNPRPESESDARKVIVRWESAMPVQDAHLKAKDADAPSIDESHYAIIVTGLPGGRSGRSDLSEKDLKSQAELKKEGKKFAKPSDVKILSRDEGIWVIYYFPRSKEITAKDSQLDFDAKLGHYGVSQTFYLQDMTYNGKLEL